MRLQGSGSVRLNCSCTTSCCQGAIREHGVGLWEGVFWLQQNFTTVELLWVHCGHWEARGHERGRYGELTSRWTAVYHGELV